MPELVSSLQQLEQHYKSLFGGDKVSALSPAFSTSAVKKRLLDAAGLNEEEYKKYRERVTNFRNEYVAHREYQCGPIAFPDLKIASMVQELRKILAETVREERKASAADAELGKLDNYYKWNKNSDLVAQFQKDAAAEMGK